jgi:hypothetical protein
MPSYKMPHIAVINESSVVDTQTLVSYATAIQHQVNQHVRPKWDVTCTIAVTDSYPAGENVWPCYVTDTIPVKGALGYHEDGVGVPTLHVAAKTTLDAGQSVSVCMSHEILEALIDPWCQSAMQVTGNKFYALEICDACEADEFGYDIGGVLVSDFVYPSWFVGSDPGPYDRQHAIQQPMDLLPGGYIGQWTPSTGWTQHTHSGGAPESHRITQRAERWPKP